VTAISGSRDALESNMTGQLFTYAESQRTESTGGMLSVLAGWMKDYAMQDHAELGRTGSVCPFVKQATRLDTVRLGISLAGPKDEASVFADIRRSFDDLKRIPAPRGKERLRTIAIGFPDCADADGIAMLERVYARHKYYTLLRSRMIAFFHAGSEIHGLWNPGFRPMQSPMPVIAVRYLIEQDAAFAAKHRLLTAPYLLRFGVGGARRLAGHWRTRVQAGSKA
jgi:hypothetical protein